MHYKPVFDHNTQGTRWTDQWRGREFARLEAAVRLLTGEDDLIEVAEHHRDSPGEQRQSADGDSMQPPWIASSFDDALHSYSRWSDDAAESLAELIHMWDDRAHSVEWALVQALCWAAASGRTVVMDRLMVKGSSPVWHGMGSQNGISWTTELVEVIEEWDELKSRLRGIWNRVEMNQNLARALLLADTLVPPAENTSTVSG